MHDNKRQALALMLLLKPNDFLAKLMISLYQDAIEGKQTQQQSLSLRKNKIQQQLLPTQQNTAVVGRMQTQALHDLR